MAIGEELTVEAPVSPDLMSRVETIMEIYHCWNKAWKKVNVRVSNETGGRVYEPEEKQLTAGFFTLGVDSFYSLLKHEGLTGSDTLDKLDGLVYVDGFDVKLGDEALSGQVHRNIQDVAALLQKEAVFVSTNLREFTDDFVDWGFYHGAALASVGLCLEGYWNRVVIPATSTYRALYPCGSHPLLDPLWSSERVAFVHDGAEATRLEKIRHIARSDLALKYLRVCWKNPGGAYNCGECPKCLRTMLGLYLSDALRNSPAFPSEIHPETIGQMSVTGENTYLYTLELWEALQEREPGSALAAAVANQLRPNSENISLRFPGSKKNRLRGLERWFKQWRKYGTR